MLPACSTLVIAMFAFLGLGSVRLHSLVVAMPAVLAPRATPHIHYGQARQTLFGGTTACNVKDPNSYAINGVGVPASFYTVVKEDCYKCINVTNPGNGDSILAPIIEHCQGECASTYGNGILLSAYSWAKISPDHDPAQNSPFDVQWHWVRDASCSTKTS